MPVLAGINLLAANPGLAIYTALTFTIVLIVLWRFAWKPIIKAIDDRNAKVEADLDSSRELREKAENLLAEYEKKMDSVKSEAVAIIDEGKKDANEVRDRIIEEAKEEAGKIKSRIENEIEQAKLKALQDLENKVVDLTVQVVSKVMKKDISDAEHTEMITRELEAVKADG